MPAYLPFQVEGTVTGADNTFNVRAFNKTKDTGCVGAIDSDGQYLIDLANCGYAVGDNVIIKVGLKSRTVMNNFTVTQAMIDAGAYTGFDMTMRELPQHIYWTIYDLISDNKPSAFTDAKDSSSVTWNVASAYSVDDANYPVIVVEPAQTNYRAISMNSSQQDNVIEIDLVVYSKLKWKKGVIDNARGHIARIVLDNESELEFAGLYLSKPEYIDESNIATVDFGSEKLNIVTLTIKLMWSP